MFNDTFLALYIVICFYLLTKNCPIYAATFLTFSLSIKAGAMLLVPSFLGWIQYQYGVWKLIVCVLIIVGFQVAIMAPLSFDSVAQLFGF